MILNLIPAIPKGESKFEAGEVVATLLVSEEDPLLWSYDSEQEKIVDILRAHKMEHFKLPAY